MLNPIVLRTLCDLHTPLVVAATAICAQKGTSCSSSVYLASVAWKVMTVVAPVLSVSKAKRAINEED